MSEPRRKELPIPWAAIDVATGATAAKYNLNGLEVSWPWGYSLSVSRFYAFESPEEREAYVRADLSARIGGAWASLVARTERAEAHEQLQICQWWRRMAHLDPETAKWWGARCSRWIRVHPDAVANAAGLDKILRPVMRDGDLDLVARDLAGETGMRWRPDGARVATFMERHNISVCCRLDGDTAVRIFGDFGSHGTVLRSWRDVITYIKAEAAATAPPGTPSAPRSDPAQATGSTP